jgi:hypothetical protein
MVKFRRKHWHRVPEFMIWKFGRWEGGFQFEVEVDGSDADGWRYFVRCRRELLVRSAPLATAEVAAATGIDHAEKLMADPLWVAADCEAEVERRAAQAAATATFFKLRNEQLR